MYLTKGTGQQTLLARTKLISNAPSHKVVKIDDMKTIDCAGATIKSIIQTFISKLFISLVKIKSKCKCNETITENEIQFMDISSICHPVVQLPDSEKCYRCKKVVKCEYTTKPIMFFVGQQTMEWGAVTKVLMFQNIIYLLHSVIEKVSTNHHVTHVMRPNSKWYTFDNSMKEVQPSNLKKRNVDIRLMTFALPSAIHFDNVLFKNDISVKGEEAVLQNYHIYKESGNIVYAKNCCGPDSLIHALTFLFRHWSDNFEGMPDGIIKSMLQAFVDSDMDTVYKLRSQIYREHFPSQIANDGALIIDCYTNIRYALDIVFSNTFSSVDIWCECENATTLHKFITLDINYNALSVQGVAKISECLSLPRRRCSSCCKQMTLFKLKSILFLDVQPLPMDSDGNAIDVDHIVNIDDIQKNFVFHEIHYTLKCVIDYDEKGSGHYTASCLLENIWYNYNDCRLRVQLASAKVNPHMLIYIQK